MQILLKLDVAGDSTSRPDLADLVDLPTPTRLDWDRDGMPEPFGAGSRIPPSPREVDSADRWTRREVRRRVGAALGQHDTGSVVTVEDPVTAALLPVWRNLLPPGTELLLVVRWHESRERQAGASWTIGDCRAVSLLSGLRGTSIDVAHLLAVSTAEIATQVDLSTHLSGLPPGRQEYDCPPALAGAPCFEQVLRTDLAAQREHDRQRVSAIHAWQAKVNVAEARTAVVTEQLRATTESRSLVAAHAAAQRSARRPPSTRSRSSS